MKYQELTIGETYLYNNKEYKVLYKHDDTQTILMLDVIEKDTVRISPILFGMFKPKVKPLPERGLLTLNTSDVIYFRTGKESGYGFNSRGNFTVHESLSFDSRPEEWREATKEDYVRFNELVIRHLKGLGFNHGDSFDSTFAWGKCTINFDSGIGFDENGLYLGGNYMYYNNEWIQPISAQNKLKKEIETRIKELEQTIQQLKKDIKE